MFHKTDPLNIAQATTDLVARNSLQQIKTSGQQARPGVPGPSTVGTLAPRHVQNVQVQKIRTSDISSKLTVTYSRDASDQAFTSAVAFVSGYKGNPAPQRMAEGQSPLSFSVENTGEPLSVSVQATGQLGSAPLSTAPTSTLQLDKTPLATTPTAAGNGTGSSSPYTEVGTPGDHFWGGVGDTSPIASVGTTSFFCPNGVSNAVGVVRFKLNTKISVRSVLISSANTVAGKAGGVGIYDSNKNILLQANFTSTSSVQLIESVISPVILDSGSYYFAFTAVDANFSVLAFQVDAAFNAMLNGVSGVDAKIATAANASSFGVLPSTLGALTALSLTNSHSIPAVLFSE